MQRHVEVMKEYQKLVAEKGFADGKGKDDRQLLWMVIEDEAVIEKQIEDVLRASGIRKSTLCCPPREKALTLSMHFYSLHLPCTRSDKLVWQSAVERSPTCGSGTSRLALWRRPGPEPG